MSVAAWVSALCGLVSSGGEREEPQRTQRRHREHRVFYIFERGRGTTEDTEVSQSFLYGREIRVENP